MARNGMSNLISQVRQLTGAGTADFSIDATTYFSDNHIQDVLDRNKIDVVESPLTYDITTDTGGTARYLTARSAYGYFETLDSGTAYFNLKQSDGSLVGTANYTVDYTRGVITFTADQGGTAYYLTGYSYDPHAAAAEIWGFRLSNFVDWYDFSADNQSLSRSQVFQHAKEMKREMDQQSGSNILSNQGDVRTSFFQRTDLW